MKPWTCILLSSAALGLAASPAAGSEAVARYRTNVTNQTLIGLSSVLAAPVDPFAETIWPPETFDELPGSVVTGRIAGLGAGLMLGVYRFAMGATDVLLAPLPMMPISPRMRFSFTPDLVHERAEDPEWLCDLDGWGEEARSWGHRLGVVVCLPAGWKGSAETGE